MTSRQRGISQTDRDLIDAAIAAGLVQYIPQGVTSIASPVWDGKGLSIPIEIRQRNDQISGNQWARDKGGRLGNALGLHRSGLSVSEIARRLRFRQVVVSDYLASVGVVDTAPPRRKGQRSSYGVSPDMLQRRAKVAALRAEGLGYKKIAATLGMPIHSVIHDVKRAGVAA